MVSICSQNLPRHHRRSFRAPKLTHRSYPSNCGSSSAASELLLRLLSGIVLYYYIQMMFWGDAFNFFWKMMVSNGNCAINNNAKRIRGLGCCICHNNNVPFSPNQLSVLVATSIFVGCRSNRVIVAVVVGDRRERSYTTACSFVSIITYSFVVLARRCLRGLLVFSIRDRLYIDPDTYGAPRTLG